MTKKEFLEALKQANKIVKPEYLNYKIVGEFENQYGEKFMVYTNLKNGINYLTGDEFDWEMGWEYTKNCEVVQRFFITVEERAKMFKLLKSKV